MSIVTTMTTEQLLSIPEDGIERDLIRGELRERTREQTMTKRNRFHTRTVSRMAYLLETWLEGHNPIPVVKFTRARLGQFCDVSRIRRWVSMSLFFLRKSSLGNRTKRRLLKVHRDWPSKSCRHRTSWKRLARK